MKFLLIRDIPQHLFTVTSKRIMRNFGTFQPLGLLFIAGSLRAAGHEVRVLDNEAERLPRDDIYRLFDSFNPDVVGFSLWTSNINYESNLGRELKQRKPSLKVIVGGPHLDLYSRETLERFDYIDYGFVGEAEQTVVEWANFVAARTTNHDVPGLIYRNGNSVEMNPPPRVEANLDVLPMPTYDLVPVDRYYSALASHHPYLYLLGSRGCPFRCTYCAKDIGGSAVRYHSPENILRQFLYYHDKLGIQEIHFYDDTFTLNQKRIVKLCNLFIEHRIPDKMRWTVRSRPDAVTADLLQLMKKAGCYRIGYGVESGNQEILDLMQRDISKEQIRTAVRIAKEAGMEVVSNFILGYPGETKKTLEDTMRFAIEIDPHYAQFTMFTYLPNSLLWNSLPEDSIPKKAWRDFSSGTIDTLHDSMLRFPGEDYSLEYLSRFHAKSNIRFYWRPSKVLQLLARIRSFKQFKQYLNQGFSLVDLRRAFSNTTGNRQASSPQDRPGTKLRNQ